MNSVYSQAYLVKFINIHDYVINIDNLKCINVEFLIDKKVKVTCKDVVAVFPDEDCNFATSIDVRHITAYEYMLKRPVGKEEGRYRVDISLRGARGLEASKKYRFVYFNDFQELLGLSEPFKIITPLQKMVQTCSLLNSSLDMYNNNEGDVAVDAQPTKGNKEGRKHWVKNIPSDLHEELVNKIKDKSEVKLQDQPRKVNKNNRKYKQQQYSVPELTNEVRRLAVQSPFPNPRPPVGCSNCHRVGQLLHTQSKLYLEIKNLAQKNDDLEKEITNLKNKVELGQAAYQKLSVLHMREREMKLHYQTAACQPIICVYHQIFEGFDSFRRPIYSFRPVMQHAPPNAHQLAQAMIEHAQRKGANDKQRLDDKVKLNQLKLKAIIGSQEEKIQALTQKLTELESNQEPKMKLTAIVKEIAVVEKQLIDQTTNISGGDDGGGQF